MAFPNGEQALGIPRQAMDGLLSSSSQIGLAMPGLFLGLREVEMISQHVSRIDDELSRVVDPQRRASLLAKKGCYFARVGQFSVAKKIVTDLRSQFDDGRSAKATIEIMLLEGLLLHFENLDRSALDRIKRAQLLSLAVKDHYLVALTSAWRAHLEFERSDFDALAVSLHMAIANADPNNYDAWSRVAILLASGYLICGEKNESSRWYEISRDNALKSGDQATIDALLYNRSTFTLVRLRAERCFSSLPGQLVSNLSSEVASARNYQILTNIVALDSQARLLKARLLLLQKDFISALAAFSALRNVAPFSANKFDQNYLELEIVFCIFSIGETDRAVEVFSSIKDLSFDGFDIDEQMVACWMLLTMAKSNALFGDKWTLELRLAELQKQYLDDCESKLKNLRSFVTPQ